MFLSNRRYRVSCCWTGRASVVLTSPVYYEIIILGMCKSQVVNPELRKKSQFVDFAIMNFENFETTAFVLHSSVETPQCMRKVMVGNPNTNQLVFLLIMKNSMILEMIFLNTMDYEKFSLKTDLISEGISSTL
jgi:hypothetical protein